MPLSYESASQLIASLRRHINAECAELEAALDKLHADSVRISSAEEEVAAARAALARTESISALVAKRAAVSSSTGAAPTDAATPSPAPSRTYATTDLQSIYATARSVLVADSDAAGAPTGAVRAFSSPGGVGVPATTEKLPATQHLAAPASQAVTRARADLEAAVGRLEYARRSSLQARLARIDRARGRALTAVAADVASGPLPEPKWDKRTAAAFGLLSASSKTALDATPPPPDAGQPSLLSLLPLATESVSAVLHDAASLYTARVADEWERLLVRLSEASSAQTEAQGVFDALALANALTLSRRETSGPPFGDASVESAIAADVRSAVLFQDLLHTSEESVTDLVRHAFEATTGSHGHLLPRLVTFQEAVIGDASSHASAVPDVTVYSEPNDLVQLEVLRGALRLALI